MEMKWNVQLADQAIKDLYSIYDYISLSLQEPQTAARAYRRIRDAILSLSFFPERCALYQREPWKSRGLRKLIIGNYVALYYTVQEELSVKVLRIGHGLQDLEQILEESQEFS